jgi:hypothetical protein
MGLDQAFQAILQMRPDTKLYPYGFTPTGYTWQVRMAAPLLCSARFIELPMLFQQHYGNDWDDLKIAANRFNRRRTLARDVVLP